MLRPSFLPGLVPGTLVAALLLAAALFTTGDAPRAHAANAVTVDSVGSVGAESSLELDGSGKPVVSYWDVTNQNLKLVHCGNVNCSAGNSITSPDSISGEYSSLVLDGAGNPVVSYLDYFNSQLAVLHCGNPNCTAGNQYSSPDTDGGGTDTSVVLDASGNAVVSYHGVDGLRVLHCNDANCAPGGDSITSPDTAGNVGYFTSLVLDASGNPVVGYWDYSNADLKVLHCNDANCAPGGDNIASPDVADNVGIGTSLVLDGSGRPVVSYWDATHGDLEVLHCGNANCTSSNTITAPDTAGNVGGGTSLALDGSGNPVVSYDDVTNNRVKVLRCGDAACSAGNTISSPDTGVSSSLELDGTGNPVVSYYDVPNHDLKVLHCTDAFCGGKIAATNDAFANETVIGPPYGVALNTLGATSAGNDPAPSCLGVGTSNTVWYQYTPPLTRKVRISTLGSDYDTVLVVYTGTKGALTEVACNDDAPASVQSQIDIQLNAGTTYHILAAKWGPTPGGGLLHFALASAPGFMGDPDTDGDGCDDSLEQDTTPGFEFYGGRRDYLNPYDYFNPSHDGQNRIDDVLLLVDAYFKDDNDGNPGLLPYDSDYSADYDRTLVGPNAWNLGPPDGKQRIDDVVNIVKQYFHDCIIS